MTHETNEFLNDLDPEPLDGGNAYEAKKYAMQFLRVWVKPMKTFPGMAKIKAKLKRAQLTDDELRGLRSWWEKQPHG